MSIWDKIPENEEELQKNPYYTKREGKWIHNGLFWQPKLQHNFRNYYKSRKNENADYPLFDILEGKFQFESNCAQCHTLNLYQRSRGPYLRDVYRRMGRTVKNYKYSRSSHVLLGFDRLKTHMLNPEYFKTCLGYPGTIVNMPQALAIIHYLMYLKTLSPTRDKFVVENDINDYGNFYFPFRHKIYPDDYSENEKKQLQKYLKKTTEERIKKREQWKKYYSKYKVYNQIKNDHNSCIFYLSFLRLYLSCLLSFFDFFYTNFSFSFF